MRLAIFDYFTKPNNPIGSCILEMVSGLCEEHSFAVFAVDFTNPCPERVRWIRVPTPRRPLALLFIAYHVLAPPSFWAFRRRSGQRFDHVLTVEDIVGFGDIVYTQFCHRSYLKHQWRYTKITGLRGAMRWLDHRLRALLEPRALRRAKWIVAPSHGLARELVKEYPFTQGKIQIISNPVDTERLVAPREFDRYGFRQRLNCNTEDIVLVFVALGHFERKGLPYVLEALAYMRERKLKLVVVGGEADLIAAYGSRVADMHLQEHVTFVGMQSDVRPYLWAADAFIFPSLYETFSLATFQAAAAGLVPISSCFSGVDEFLRDGENGILIEPTADGVAYGIRRYLALPPEIRSAMGEQARQDVQAYSLPCFISAWREFFLRIT